MPKKARRTKAKDDLNITSMMDMMTIILVFLLKNFSATEVTVTPSDKLKLPTSSAKRDPDVAVSVVVQKDQILVDDKTVLGLTSKPDKDNPGEFLVTIPDSERNGPAVTKLVEAFNAQADAAKKIGGFSKARDDLQFKGRVLLQIDKDIPFALVRDVMYNAGQAQFAEFEFIVIKNSE
jgi:biopolymer transport protein ExbD